MYQWGQEKALFHNKETRYLTGSDNAVVGFSRSIGDVKEAAWSAAGQARNKKAEALTAYAKGQYVDEGGGSRTAGRNKYLELLDKHRAIEYSLDEVFGSQMAKATLGAERQLRNKYTKLDEQLGIPKSPPMLEPIPGVDKFGQFMDGLDKAVKIGKVVAAPFTGGATLGMNFGTSAKDIIKADEGSSFDFSSLMSNNWNSFSAPSSGDQNLPFLPKSVDYSSVLK